MEELCEEAESHKVQQAHIPILIFSFGINFNTYHMAGEYERGQSDTGWLGCNLYSMTASDFYMHDHLLFILHVFCFGIQNGCHSVRSHSTFCFFLVQFFLGLLLNTSTIKHCSVETINLFMGFSTVIISGVLECFRNINEIFTTLWKMKMVSLFYR